MTAPALPELLADLSHTKPRRLVATALRASPLLRQGLPLTVLLALLAGAGRIIAPRSEEHTSELQSQ